MAQLTDKITQINEQFYDVSNNIKKIERRLDTLNNHLLQFDSYTKNRDTYKKYNSLAPKKRDDFYDKHFEEIQSFQDAKKYLDGVMNGRKDIPLKSWKKEQTNLIAEKYNLCEKYYQLKDETHSVELLRRGAENLMREDGRESPIRNRGLEI